MVKRIIFLFFAVLFVCMTMLSCGGDAPGNADNNAKNTEAEEILTVADEEEAQIPDYIIINGESYSTKETELELIFIPITDADVEQIRHMVNLQSLTIMGTKEISNISPLAELINLTEFSLSRTLISDISPLAGLTNLKVLNLGYNQIADISPLAGLINLTKLSLWDSQINDISPLAGLTNLSELYLGNNPISEISPLAGLTNLTNLVLPYGISDLSPLAGLTHLEYLNLNLTDHPITDATRQQITELWEALPNTDIRDALQVVSYNTRRGPDPEMQAASKYESINRDYDWYFDQRDTGEYSNANCGPTVAVMAAKWYNQDFAKTPEEVRNEFDISIIDGIHVVGDDDTKGWYMGNILEFLISVSVDVKAASNLNAKKALNYLDMGNIIIVGLYMEYVKTGRYEYGTTGHFLIVKGYTIFDGELYFEVYDPNSGGLGLTYHDGSPFGKDRLYSASEVIEGNLKHGSMHIVVDAP